MEDEGQVEGVGESGRQDGAAAGGSQEGRRPRGVDHHSGDGHGVEGGDEVSGIDLKSRRETGRRYTSITIILRKSEDGGKRKGGWRAWS